MMYKVKVAVCPEIHTKHSKQSQHHVDFFFSILHLVVSFEMWCWRRMEKISWTDHVRNEEVLLRVNEQRNILHEIRKRKAN